MPETQSSLDTFRDVFHRHDWAATALGPMSGWPLLLRRSKDLLLDTPQPSFITWGDTHEMLFNGAFAAWLGPDYGASLGAPVPALWKEWPNLAPFFRTALAGRGVLAEDVALTGAAGETRHATVSFAPLRAFDDQVIGVIGLASDTTDKVRARERLESEHERLLRMLEDAPGFVGKMSVPDFRFIAANRAYRRLVGERALLGRSIGEALPDLAAQGIVDILEQVRTTGAPFVEHALPLRLANPTGEEERVIDVVCAPLADGEGRVEAIFVAGHDVTEHVRSAARVEELQSELIHLSRVSAMGTMASTLGHELNQPLTAIVNYATVARRCVPDGAPPQLDDALEAIADNAMRCGKLIRSVRTMSRKGSTTQAVFRVGEAVTEAVKLGALSCLCQVTVRIPKGLTAFGDRVQIEQVLINLVRNACEASLAGSAGEVEITARASGDKAVVTVSDRGSGIAFDPVDRVFAPFMSTKPEGIGIGLPISRTIAEAHGGRLWAENRAGGGAAFHLELPRNASAARGHERAAAGA